MSASVEPGHQAVPLLRLNGPWPSISKQFFANFSHQKLIWDKTQHLKSLHKRWFHPQMLPRQGTILETKSKTSSSTSAMN